MTTRLPLILCAWLLFAVVAMALVHPELDTDSAMRLAGVRDLLHGQAWFDTSQHRMNTPYGLSMHWSRLVDAPLAALAYLSEPLALYAWPLGLFLGVLLLLARLAEALAGPRAVPVVLILALLASATWTPFLPGDIDHHGLQLLLMLAALTGLVEARPILTAIAVALGLGVGLESLPYAALACVVAALWLCDDPARARRFGVTLAGLALLLLVATTATAYRTQPACDTYSLFYALLLAAGGGGVAAISLLPRYRPAVLALLGAGLVLLAAWCNPGCLAGPYAGMSAQMHVIFLDRINEALPVWRAWALSPSQMVGGFGYGLVALLAGLWAPPGRARHLVMAFAVLALLVAVLQIRAVPFAVAFALPLLAAALTVRLRRPLAIGLAALLASSAVFTAMAAAMEGPALAARAKHFQAQVACGNREAMAPLLTLPPGRVAAFVDQGPAVLAYTHHAVIAGPYHRDSAGIVDSYRIFAGPDPRAVLKARGIDYLMICRAAPDWDFYRLRGGLMAQLAAGKVPRWLALSGRAGDVTVYRVMRD